MRYSPSGTITDVQTGAELLQISRVIEDINSRREEWRDKLTAEEIAANLTEDDIADWNKEPGNVLRYGAAETYVAGVDDTAFVQTALNSGHKVVYLTRMFEYTFLEVPDGVTLIGDGIGTGLIRKSGLQYYDSGANTGSYGLRPKSGIAWCAFYNFELDGQADTSVDHSEEYTQLWDGSTSVQGRIKEGGLCVSRLADSTYIAPDFVFIDKIYSHDHVRNNFLFQAGTDGVAPTVLIGSIVAENSDIDHCFYSDTGEICQVGNLTIRGFASSGYIISSGAQFDNIYVEDITLNPNDDTAHSAPFDTHTIIDDRNDTRGSQIGRLQINGDLENLDGEDSFREIIRARGYGLQVDSLKIEATDDTDYALDLISVRTTSGAPGNVRGTTIESINARGLPDSCILAALDANAYGTTITGFKIGQFTLEYRAADVSANALVVAGGNNLENVDIGNGFVYCSDFAEGGPKQVFDSDITGTLSGCHFHDIRMDDADITEEAWDIDAGAGTYWGLVFERIITRNTAPTGDNRTYSHMRDCRFVDDHRMDPADTVIDITTTDDSVTTAFSYNAFQGHDISDDTVVLVEVSAIAVFDNGADRAGYKLNELWYRNGGGATRESDDTAMTFLAESTNWSTATVDTAADTNNLLIRVTGLASTTIHWRMHVKIMALPRV